jgi:hypothetical protein
VSSHQRIGKASGFEGQPVGCFPAEINLAEVDPVASFGERSGLIADGVGSMGSPIRAGVNRQKDYRPPIFSESDIRLRSLFQAVFEPITSFF